MNNFILLHSLKIIIYNIKLKKFDKVNNYLSIVISCSSGTYIRTLAHDIGQALGCGAYLKKLVRTKIGDYKLKNAVELDELNKNNWKYFSLHLS